MCGAPGKAAWWRRLPPAPCGRTRKHLTLAPSPPGGGSPQHRVGAPENISPWLRVCRGAGGDGFPQRRVGAPETNTIAPTTPAVTPHQAALPGAQHSLSVHPPEIAIARTESLLNTRQPCLQLVSGWMHQGRAASHPRASLAAPETNTIASTTLAPIVTIHSSPTTVTPTQHPAPAAAEFCKQKCSGCGAGAPSRRETRQRTGHAGTARGARPHASGRRPEQGRHRIVLSRPKHPHALCPSCTAWLGGGDEEYRLATKAPGENTKGRQGRTDRRKPDAHLMCIGRGLHDKLKQKQTRSGRRQERLRRRNFSIFSTRAAPAAPHPPPPGSHIASPHSTAGNLRPPLPSLWARSLPSGVRRRAGSRWGEKIAPIHIPPYYTPVRSTQP
eukprot:gene18186-biopygen14466